mmetsp:Transcript_16106/g.30947  ORF Transcript_16106/g.30947 Transcript_16106/m.30947 type:complete len:83 (+) Transcript_16106:197-445(+)
MCSGVRARTQYAFSISPSSKIIVTSCYVQVRHAVFAHTLSTAMGLDRRRTTKPSSTVSEILYRLFVCAPHPRSCVWTDGRSC